MKIAQTGHSVEIRDEEGCIRRVVHTPAPILSVKTAGSVPGYVVILLADGRQAVYSGHGRCIRNDWRYPRTGGVKPKPQYNRDKEEKVTVTLTNRPFVAAAQKARELGFAELAGFIDLAYSDERVRRPAADLGAVFLNYERVSAIGKVTTRLIHRELPVAERAEAWLSWMGILKSPKVYGADTYLLKNVVNGYVRCVTEMRAPGWTDIRCLFPWIAGMQRTRHQGNPSFEKALAEDRVPSFDMLCTLGVGKLTRPVLRDILDRDDAGEIAEHVLTNRPEVFKLMTPREILLHVCVACPTDAKSIRIVKCLFRRDHDVCRSVDRNGFSPLTYCLFAHRGGKCGVWGDFVIRPRRFGLERLLVENGCNPDQKDCFGLSWRDIVARHDIDEYL